MHHWITVPQNLHKNTRLVRTDQPSLSHGINYRSDSLLELAPERMRLYFCLCHFLTSKKSFVVCLCEHVFDLTRIFLFDNVTIIIDPCIRVE